MWKRYVFLAVAVIACSGFIITRQQFLSTHDADLFLDMKTVDAKELHSPAPGKAYAFHEQSRTWEQTELCRQVGVDVTPL
jgi:hypothetical protein